MRIVLDTNVLLQILPGRSPYHSIFQHFLSGSFTWIVTLDVYLEYIEILQQRGAENVDFYIHKLLCESQTAL